MDPQWTSPVPSGRVLNPTGAVTIRDRSFNRLLYPVLSNAITHRLRYLSFWCWLVKNTEGLSPAEQANYEKIFLFASRAHRCRDQNELGENGLVGAGRNVEKLPAGHPHSSGEAEVRDLYSEEIDPIPLSEDFAQLTTSNESGFEAYYRNWLKRLLLIKNRSTVTNLGDSLANAYSEAHGIPWERFENAVTNKAVSQDLLQELAGTGCVCSLSDQERELCFQMWFGLINREPHYKRLDFASSSREELRKVRVEQFLQTHLNEEDDPLNIEEEELTIEPLDQTDDSKEESDLERYLRYGFDVHMRASQLLFLHSGAAASGERIVCPGSEHPLEEIRTLWRFHIQSEQFAWILETLLTLFLETLRDIEPCNLNEILDRLTTPEAFEKAVCDALGGLSSQTGDGTTTSFDEVKLGILYGDNYSVNLQVRSTDNSEPYPDSWADLVQSLPNGDNRVFDREAISEWQLQQRIDQAHDATNLSTAERLSRACGYGAVLLARFQSRYDQYYGREDLAPYRRWFIQTTKYADEPPNLTMIWSPTDNLGIDQSQPVRHVTKRLLQYCLVEPYLDRLYDRMESGQIPQHFTVDGRGKLRFERQYGGLPLSRLKYNRVSDTLYELGLISSNRYREFEVTDRAEELLTFVMEGQNS